MRILSALLFTLAVAQTPARPDFSGAWELHNSSPVQGAKRAAMLGEKFTAKQDPKTLTLAISAMGRMFDAVYNLDGSESRLVSPTGPGLPDEVIISRATWEGDRLVIRTTSKEILNGKAVDMTTRRVMRIDANGLLVLERSGTPPELVESSVSVYRRTK